MLSTSIKPQTLRSGAFVRVRADHPDSTRAGLDATVVCDSGEEIGLIFGADRFGRDQGALCAGIEAWDKTEVDLSSAEY